MARKIPSTIEDLHRRHHGAIMVECPGCSRKRIYHLGDVRKQFRQRGWDDRLHRIAERFRCVACGARPTGIIWVGEGFPPPAGAVWTCFAPFGIDADAWARASPAERDRLVKRRR